MVFGTEDLRNAIIMESNQQFEAQLPQRVQNAALQQEEHIKASCAPAVLSQILRDMSSADLTVQGLGLLASLNVASKLDSPHASVAIDILIGSGILHKCVKLLRPETNLQILNSAVWLLLNIAASKDSAKTRAIVNSGAVAPLIDLLTSPHRDVMENALWGLANIVGDGPYARDYAIHKGLILPLVALVETQTDDLRILSQASRALSNIFQVEHPGVPTLVARQCLPALARLIVHENTQIVRDVSWILYHISRSQEGIQEIVNSGLVVPLVTLMGSRASNIYTLILGFKDSPIQIIIVNCLWALVNIVSGNNSQIQVIVDAGILNYIPNLLRSYSNEGYYQVAAIIVARIAAGTAAQRQATFDAGVIWELIYVMKFENARTAACFAIRNVACQGDIQQLTSIYDREVIQVWCDIVTSSSSDTEAIALILEGIEGLLKGFSEAGQLETVLKAIERYDGYDKIEHLLEHEDQTINSRAYNLLDMYFDANLADADTPQPVQEMDTSELYHMTVRIEEPDEV